MVARDGVSDNNQYVPTNWTWIFQAKPGEWDLRGQLAEQPRAQWKVSAFAADMKIGDTVYLWESGPNAALLAKCRLTSKPAVQPLRPELQPYVRHPKYLEECRPPRGARHSARAPTLNAHQARTACGAGSDRRPTSCPAGHQLQRPTVGGRASRRSRGSEPLMREDSDEKPANPG